MIAFLAVGVLMTLAAIALVIVPLFREPARPAPVAALLVALGIPAAVVLLYAAIGSPAWQSSPEATLVESGAPGSASPQVQTAQERVRQAPEDQAAWAALAQAYFEQESFGNARDAYRQALTIGGDAATDELRLAFAEAAILADQNSLAGEAGRIVDEVLSRDPVNRKALWYGGMAALGRGDLQSAKSRWSKLLELSPPPQVRQILEQQLARIDATPAAAEPASAQAVRIPVRVDVRPELAGKVKPGAVLFLIARGAEAAGPPVAVIRREVAKLPLDLEISDADSMVPGRSLSGLAEVNLTARIANDGEALPAAGDVFGATVWNPAMGAVRLQILMDQIVK